MNKQIKQTSILFFNILVLITSFINAQESKQNKTAGIPEYESRELITDKTFKRRFYNHVAGTTTFTNTIGCINPQDPSVWNVAEWSSHSSFLNMAPTTTGTGMCKFANNYKDFRFGGPVGAEAYDIYFAVNSQSEYNNVYRQANEPWTHLLVEQRLSPPYTHIGQGPGCPWLSMLRSLNFKVDAKLYYNQTIQTAGYDPNIHAAQFLIYFTVQNLRTSSTNDFLWVGIPLYDDRYDFISNNPFVDPGTQKLIYTIPFSEISLTSMRSGSWVSLNFDLLPYAKKALQAAWNSSPQQLTESHDYADYKIGGINMGWELPGMNISTVVVKNLSLVANTNQLFWGVQRTASITENEPAIAVFPNPASDDRITFSGKKIQTISIVNYLGQEVLRSKNADSATDEVNVDISRLAPGVYYSLVKTEEGMEKLKLIKQ
jgi:hypothetical protein